MCKKENKKEVIKKIDDEHHKLIKQQNQHNNKNNNNNNIMSSSSSRSITCKSTYSYERERASWERQTTKYVAYVAAHNNPVGQYFENWCDYYTNIMGIRISTCHNMKVANVRFACGGDKKPWLELDKTLSSILETLLCFAVSNKFKRMFGGLGRRLPEELVAMVMSEFLVEHVYVCMANSDVMAHLGRIPTGLPPFLNVGLPMIYTRNVAHVELMPEELAGACVKTTTPAVAAAAAAADATLTLKFVAADGTLQALHYC